MKGALPPSSSDTFLTVAAQAAISCLPISVEPVKLSLRTIGLPVISPPISRADPVTMLSNPAGSPARSARTAMAKAENGVAVAGLITIGQPAASAGPALRVIIAAGEFPGGIAAQTPIGSLVTTMGRAGGGGGVVLARGALPPPPRPLLKGGAQ